MEDKQTTVSWLYTVRAGLSAISLERDKADSIEKNYEKKKHEEKQKFIRNYGENGQVELDKSYDEGFDRSKCSVGGIEREANYNAALQSFRNEQRRLNADYDNHLKSFKKAIYIFVGIALLIIGLILLIVGIVLPNSSAMLIVGGVALIGGGIFSIFFAFAGPSKAYKVESEKMRKAIEAVDGNIRACARLRDLCLNYEKKKEGEIDEVGLSADKLYEQLAEIIGDTLDPRDWKYVDLLIYYFETNRAETIREALQLIDRELQTQAIIGSVNASTQQICKTIQNEANRLNNMIAECCNAMNKMNENLTAIRGNQIAQIIQQEMSDALLRKATASSEQLAKDVAYFKNRKH